MNNKLLLAALFAVASPQVLALGALDVAYLEKLQLERGGVLGEYLAGDAARLTAAQTKYGFDSSITAMTGPRATAALKDFFKGNKAAFDAAMIDHGAALQASSQGATMKSIDAVIKDVQDKPCHLETFNHCTQHLERAIGREVGAVGAAPAAATHSGGGIRSWFGGASSSGDSWSSGGGGSEADASTVPSDVFGSLNGACVRHILPSQFNSSPSCECLANYLVSERRKRVRGNTMGFNERDDKVLKASDDIAKTFSDNGKPGMMTIPAEIQALLNEGGGNFPEGYRSRLPAGWQALEYSSRTVGNPVDAGNPRSYRRILFKIPGQDFDRWIQFTSSTASGPASERQNLVDFIAVQKSDPESGAKLTEPRIHFNQFWRQYSGSSVAVTRRDHAGQSFDACITCHPNGMREISPSPGSVGADQKPILDAFNATMRGYGKMDWGPSFDVPSTDPHSHSALGPPIGASSGCIRCHNGLEPTPEQPENRGALTRETSTGHVRHKLLGDLSMPPRPYLADFWEKVALADSSVDWNTEDYRRLQLELVEPNNNDEYNSYRRVLNRLKNEGRITDAEHSELNQELADYKAEGEDILELFRGETEKEVDAWLSAMACGPRGENLDENEASVSH
jgi:hypothetical protein